MEKNYIYYLYVYLLRKNTILINLKRKKSKNMKYYKQKINILLKFYKNKTMTSHFINILIYNHVYNSFIIK